MSRWHHVCQVCSVIIERTLRHVISQIDFRWHKPRQNGPPAQGGVVFFAITQPSRKLLNQPKSATGKLRRSVANSLERQQGSERLDTKISRSKRNIPVAKRFRFDWDRDQYGRPIKAQCHSGRFLRDRIRRFCCTIRNMKCHKSFLKQYIEGLQGVSFGYLLRQSSPKCTWKTV